MKRFGLLCLLALCAVNTFSQQLTVAAAASLSDAFRSIGTQFEQQHPGLRIRWNFTASDVLARQIMQGAPVDVFASADAVLMDRLLQMGLIEASTKRDFAANTLVLVTAKDSPFVSSLRGLNDLNDSKIRRIAIGKPASVPAGRYAQEALQKADVFNAIAPKLVYGDHVRQVLDYAARGEVDAAFVYATDAQLMPAKVRMAFPVATGKAIQYPVAVLSESKEKQLAKAFVQFLQSPAALSILKQAGFEQP